jgi:ADP-ribose pyrophosphatase
MTAKVNHRRLIEKGRIFDITSENVTLPNNYTLDLEIIRHPGASAIVPLTDKAEVLLLKQYRHAVGEYIWEIPAGTFDGSEDPLVCAKRELTEETGYQALQWSFLSTIVPVPGYSDEQIHLFLAHDLTPAQQKLDRDEVLEVCPMPIQRVLSMISNGKINDAKTIAGILLTVTRPDSPLSDFQTHDIADENNPLIP